MGVLTILDIIIRAAILVASIFSFYPQINKIVSTDNAGGISLFYLLFGTTSAMEQLTLYLGHFLFHESFPDSEVNTPPSVGDWLNFFQIWVLLLGSTTTFAVAIWHPPSRALEKSIVILAYIACAYGSFLPIIPYFWKPKSGTGQLGPDMFLAAHAHMVNWFVTAGIFPLSLLFEWFALRGHPVPGGLSVRGLATQAVVFVLMGISWTWRMTIDDVTWVEWYEYVGYPAVDNFLFGVVQALLLAYVTWWRAPIAEGGAQGNGVPGETSPLLPN